ncbi:unnamed protein product, partial [Ectocarpus fasciculatus]
PRLHCCGALAARWSNNTHANNTDPAVVPVQRPGTSEPVPFRSFAPSLRAEGQLTAYYHNSRQMPLGRATHFFFLYFKSAPTHSIGAVYSCQLQPVVTQKCPLPTPPAAIRDFHARKSAAVPSYSV